MKGFPISSVLFRVSLRIRKVLPFANFMKGIG